MFGLSKAAQPPHRESILMEIGVGAESWNNQLSKLNNSAFPCCDHYVVSFPKHALLSSTHACMYIRLSSNASHNASQQWSYTPAVCLKWHVLLSLPYCLACSWKVATIRIYRKVSLVAWSNYLVNVATRNGINTLPYTQNFPLLLLVLAVQTWRGQIHTEHEATGEASELFDKRRFKTWLKQIMLL
jgi:hypothetical protein